MNMELNINNIINSFKNNNNCHAFLFSTNNLEKCHNTLINMIKKINCKNENQDNCNCQICKLIENGNNPDVIDIHPNGKEYKVDQINELLEIFNTKPTISKYKIYIINEADTLGTICSNKLLKFLEEPESNIIGFFITNNLQGILTTIQSRCEIFNFNYEQLNILDLLDINENDFNKYYNQAINLLFLLNDSPKYILMLESKKLLNYDRDDLLKFINILKNMYIIKYKVLMNEIKREDYMEQILDNISSNDIIIIVKRIKLLDNIFKDLKFNVNKELIINKLFLMWE